MLCLMLFLCSQVDEAVAVLQAHQAKEAAQKSVPNTTVPAVWDKVRFQYCLSFFSARLCFFFCNLCLFHFRMMWAWLHQDGSITKTINTEKPDTQKIKNTVDTIKYFARLRVYILTLTILKKILKKWKILILKIPKHSFLFIPLNECSLSIVFLQLIAEHLGNWI